MAEKDCIRARYITASEKTMLVTLIEERSEILFNKSHDFRIIHRKKAAWEEVTSLFNAAGYGPPRSQQQLKKVWENAKGKAKKQHAAYKRETMRTGGGAPPKPEDEETAKILTIISDDLDGEENELDCDALQSTGQPHTVIGIRNDGQKCEIRFDSQIMAQHTNNSIHSITTPPKLTSTEFNTTQSTPAGKVSSQEANMTQDTQTNTPTSIQFNARDTPTEYTPTPGQSNFTPARKRRRTRKFTQEASFEASLEMQRKEHEKTMESLSLDIEVKSLDIEIKREKLKKIKKENEDANLCLQAHQIWVDVGKKMLEVTGELGQVTKRICDKLDALN
ncbi:myb/SANT-like DNA-binding domain-containing protein 3 [Palaemon carinicauda]|uniref:myb/SANT-like DNA-binding domain-containing protein 3 n=1 Tax=Palaemon carinicauda TaxID=392227 RepID=UPI0035B66CEA